jgi:hypothetical protein
MGWVTSLAKITTGKTISSTTGKEGAVFLADEPPLLQGHTEQDH